jgi:hypothetical protein
MLTRLPYYIGIARPGHSEISQHDAIWLIHNGKDTLEEVPIDQLIDTLDTLYATQRGTLVDVYMYNPVDAEGIRVDQVDTDFYSSKRYQTYIQQ